MIDFVLAFLRKDPMFVLVSRLCSVNITSVSWGRSCNCPVPLKSGTGFDYSWWNVLSIFFAKYSLWMTSFSFCVKTSISSLASLSQGWLRTSTALNLFLGSTYRREWIRLVACSESFTGGCYGCTDEFACPSFPVWLALGLLMSYFPLIIILCSSCIVEALKGTVPISMA